MARKSLNLTLCLNSSMLEREFGKQPDLPQPLARVNLHSEAFRSSSMHGTSPQRKYPANGGLVKKGFVFRSNSRERLGNDELKETKARGGVSSAPFHAPKGQHFPNHPPRFLCRHLAHQRTRELLAPRFGVVEFRTITRPHRITALQTTVGPCMDNICLL